MKEFRTDNTEGYTQNQLDRMNEMYELEISELDENDPHYEDECKNIGDKIASMV